MMDRLNALLNSALAYEVSGVDALDRADFNGAVESFRKGVEVAPKEPSLHHKLGTALALLGDTAAAVEQFNQALTLDPNFVKAHYSLAVIQASTDQTAAAIQHFERRAEGRARLRRGTAAARACSAAKRTARTPRFRTTRKSSRRTHAFRKRASATLPRSFACADEPMLATIWPTPCASTRTSLRLTNALARVLAAAPDDKVRDGRRALATVQPVIALVRARDTLETMAMVQAEVGQFTRPCGGSRTRLRRRSKPAAMASLLRIADNLRFYESRKPCRTPWRPDEPIEFQPTGGPQAIQSPHL